MISRLTLVAASLVLAGCAGAPTPESPGSPQADQTGGTGMESGTIHATLSGDVEGEFRGALACDDRGLHFEASRNGEASGDEAEGTDDVIGIQIAGEQVVAVRFSTDLESEAELTLEGDQRSYVFSGNVVPTSEAEDDAHGSTAQSQDDAVHGSGNAGQGGVTTGVESDMATEGGFSATLTSEDAERPMTVELDASYAC